MSTFKLSNISLRDFRKFLKKQGLEMTTIAGGHEKWEKAGLLRPVMLQTHIDPIPERIVKQAMRHLKMTRKEFVQAFTKK